MAFIADDVLVEMETKRAADECILYDMIVKGYYVFIDNANQWLINQHAAAKRAKTNDNKPFDDLTLEATLICVLV